MRKSYLTRGGFGQYLDGKNLPAAIWRLRYHAQIAREEMNPAIKPAIKTMPVLYHGSVGIAAERGRA